MYFWIIIWYKITPNCPWFFKEDEMKTLVLYSFIILYFTLVSKIRIVFYLSYKNDLIFIKDRAVSPLKLNLRKKKKFNKWFILKNFLFPFSENILYFERNKEKKLLLFNKIT